MDGERCYQCGRGVGPRDSSCPACGAVQNSVCEDCYATVSVYAETCAGCGAELLPKRYSPSKVPWVILAGVLVFGVLGYGFYLTVIRNPARELFEDFREARGDLRAGRLEEARRKFEGLKGDYPAVERVHLLLGETFVGLGDLDAAAEEFEAALAAEERLAAAALDLAEVEVDRGRYGRALSMARRAIDGGADPARCRRAIGSALTRPGLRDASEALVHLEAAVEAGAADAESLHLVAGLYDEIRRAVPYGFLDETADRWRRRADAAGPPPAPPPARADEPDETERILARVDALLAEPSGRPKALELLRLAVVDSRPASRANLRLADLLLDTPDSSPSQRDRIREAARLLAAAEEHRRPSDVTLAAQSLLRGKLALRERDYPLAIERLTAVAARTPEEPAPHRLLAEAHAARGEPDLEALEITSEMIVAGRSADRLLRRGAARLRAGLPSAALADARDARALDPDGVGPALLAARIHLAPGRVDPSAAIADLGAVAGRPDAPAEARILLGTARAALGRTDEARATWRAVIAEAPREEDRLAALAALADMEDRLAGRPASPELEQWYRRYVEAHAGSAAGWTAWALRRLATLGPASAAQAAREALRVEPGNAVARGILVEVGLTGGGSLDEIDRLVAEVTSDEPEGALAYFLRGRMELADGDASNAVVLLEGARNRAPLDARYAFWLGIARERTGDTESAGRAFRRSLRLDPGGLECRLRLARLGAEDGAPFSAGTIGSRESLAAARDACRGLIRDLTDPAREPGEVDVEGRLVPAWVLFGNLCHALGDREGLLEACDAHVALRPDDAVAARRRELAVEAEGATDREQADPLVREILGQTGGGDSGAIVRRAREFADHAREVEREGNLAAVRDSLARGHSILACALRDEGWTELAEHHFWRSLRLRPTGEQALVGFADLLRSRLADRPSPGTAGALAGILVRTARLKVAAGEREAARAALEEAARVFPEIAETADYRSAAASAARTDADAERK